MPACLQDASLWQGGATQQQAALAPWQQLQQSHGQDTNGAYMPWQTAQQEPTPQAWAQAQQHGSVRPWLPRPGGSDQAANGSIVQMQRLGTMSQGIAAQPPPAAMQGQATGAAMMAAGKATGSKVRTMG